MTLPSLRPMESLAMTQDKAEPNELDVLMKVLDIVKLRIETRELRNYETVQITQIANQFLPGTTIGAFIQNESPEQQGDVVMGDKYEARDHAQIGAMGNRPRVNKVTFGNPQGKATEVDLARLLQELHSLRTEMRNQASTTADDQAVVAIGQAISAAEEGDSSSLFEHLRSAGKWAIGVATAIGAELAAMAIKSALGV